MFRPEPAPDGQRGGRRRGHAVDHPRLHRAAPQRRPDGRAHLRRGLTPARGPRPGGSPGVPSPAWMISASISARAPPWTSPTTIGSVTPAASTRPSSTRSSADGAGSTPSSRSIRPARRWSSSTCTRIGRAGAAVHRVVGPINAMADALRRAGGWVAWVTSEIDPSRTDAPDQAGGRRAGRHVHRGRAARVAGRGDVARPRRAPHDDVFASKRGTSAFFPGNCSLPRQLDAHDITSILIAGTVTNVCCESSARDATELGYEVTMVSDACHGHSYGLHEASLATFFRIFGDVRPATEVLDLIAAGDRPRPWSGARAPDPGGRERGRPAGGQSSARRSSRRSATASSPSPSRCWCSTSPRGSSGSALHRLGHAWPDSSPTSSAS